MPIRPERRALYPAREEWQAIREAILLRAGDCCEGSPRYPSCRASNGEPHPVTGSRVVLTIAHMEHDPRDSRPEVLRALCQRCHNAHDAQFRATNRRANDLRSDESLTLEL